MGRRDPSDPPKYQYHVLTWGGFYNDEHKAIHGMEDGDFLFDSAEERTAFIEERTRMSKNLGATALMTSCTEGFHCDVRTVLHRVSEYMGVRKYTTYDIGINYPMSVAAYHMANKWYPGFNDYPFGENEAIYDGDNPDFQVLDEWITGATCRKGPNDAGNDDLECLHN